MGLGKLLHFAIIQHVKTRFPSAHTYENIYKLTLFYLFVKKNDYKNYEFTNSDKILQTDPYENIGYKYRDVFDDLAEVTASTICINEDDDELELRDITDAKYTNTLQGTFLTLTDSKEDIIKVNDIKKHKIIIHTTKGKIKVDHELHNSKKILAKLEEKNIPIKEVLIFEKMFPNAKI